MRNKYKIFIVFYFIIMVLVVFTSKDMRLFSTALEYIRCGSANGIPKPVPQLITIAYTLLIVGTPIILITFSIITIMKAVSSGNQEDIMKAKNKLFKKFISAGIIFLLASVVQFVITRVSTTDNDEMSTVMCLNCFLYYSDTNCPTSDSGNDVERGTYFATYESQVHPTVANRQFSSAAVRNSLVASKDGRFMWPLPSPYDKSHITSTYGGRKHPITGVYQKAHGAIDIAAPARTPIYAAADGTVVISGWDNSYGNYVKIDHGDGWSTLYAHQTERVAVKGDTIRQGEILGYVGTTGSSTGNHLHFEVRYNNERLDPLDFFE